MNPASEGVALVNHAHPNLKLLLHSPRNRAKHYATKLRNLALAPRVLLMYSLARFACVRRRWPLHAGNNQLRHAAPPSGVIPFERATVLQNLQKNGFHVGLQLPDEATRQLNDFVEANLCSEDGNLLHRFHCSEHCAAEQRVGRRILLGWYPHPETKCSSIASLLADPALIDLATTYLGGPPRSVHSRLWWSFAQPQSDALEQLHSGQAFHYDMDDWRRLTLFFYLRDVDANAGAHTLIQRSHLRKKLSYILSLSKAQREAELQGYYPAEDFIEIHGSAGFGFAEDLYCFHRGNPPKNKDRLILQLVFSLTR